MKRYSLVVLVVVLGLVVAAPASGSTDIHSPKAQVATKKKCKKGYKRARRHGEWKCVKKKPAYVPPAYVSPPPAPLYLSDSEAYNAAREAVYEEFASGPQAQNPDAFWGVGACSRRSAYQVGCYAYVGFFFLPGIDMTCAWTEVVTRVGYDGLSLSKEDVLPCA